MANLRLIFLHQESPFVFSGGIMVQSTGWQRSEVCSHKCYDCTMQQDSPYPAYNLSILYPNAFSTPSGQGFAVFEQLCNLDSNNSFIWKLHVASLSWAPWSGLYLLLCDTSCFHCSCCCFILETSSMSAPYTYALGKYGEVTFLMVLDYCLSTRKHLIRPELPTGVVGDFETEFVMSPRVCVYHAGSPRGELRTCSTKHNTKTFPCRPS